MKSALHVGNFFPFFMHALTSSIFQHENFPCHIFNCIQIFSKSQINFFQLSENYAIIYIVMMQYFNKTSLLIKLLCLFIGGEIKC